MAELAIALPRLGPLADLLARLLTALETPSGETSRRLAAMMAEIEGLAAGLAASATALSALASEEGTLGALGARLERLEAEMAAARQEAREAAQVQARQAARILDRLDQAMSWLGAPWGETAPTPEASRTTDG